MLLSAIHIIVRFFLFYFNHAVIQTKCNDIHTAALRILVSIGLRESAREGGYGKPR